MARKATPAPAPVVEEEVTLEEYLLQETGQPQKSRRESQQDYLVRIAQACDQLDDNWYNAQEDDAKQWCDAAAQAVKDGTTVPDFDGTVEEEEPAPAPTRGRAAPTPEPTRGRGARTVEAAPEPATRGRGGRAAPAPAPTPEPDHPVISTNERIMELIVEDPQITGEDIMAKLEEEQHELSAFAVYALRAEILRFLKVLQEYGMLTENMV